MKIHSTVHELLDADRWRKRKKIISKIIGTFLQLLVTNMLTKQKNSEQVLSHKDLACNKVANHYLNSTIIIIIFFFLLYLRPSCLLQSHANICRVSANIFLSIWLVQEKLDSNWEGLLHPFLCCNLEVFFH